MKTDFQVLHFIECQPFKTSSDWEIVQLFCQKHHIRLGTFQPSYNPSDGLTGSQFLDWYHDGFGAGDIAICRNFLAVISDGKLDVAEIAGFFGNKGFESNRFTSSTSELIKVDPDTQHEYHVRLSHENLEYCRKNFTVTKKYVPKINERVTFWNNYESGIGVIRSIDPAANEVELYCWYNYTTKKIGYSMHEAGIVTFHDYHFEPMSVVAQRRLNTELAKYGKVWYDKLHRIEPLSIKVEVGERYWYINDKMKVIQETEKGTPTSHFRYIAGNYFSRYEEALEYLGKITELLRDRFTK